jgi:hypothetical protein
MKLFLQIEIRHWQQGGYGSQLLGYASSLSNDIVGTDLDSQSEAVIADLVIRLIDQSKKVFLLVQIADPNLPLGAAQKVFDHLLASPANISHVVQSGDHRTVEAVLQSFRPHYIKENDQEKIRKLILEFSL